MTNNEFKKEILNYIEKSYDSFVECQNMINEMFSVFHEICMKHDIHYYYGFGSLLGIVRDKGMIPWDADIDVVIPVNKMKHLIKVLESELPSDYYVLSNFIDKNYYLCETRICRQNFDPDVYHIDIFYLIGAPENRKTLLLFDKKVKKAFYYRALRFQKITKGSTTRDKLVFYTKKIIKIFLKIKPDYFFNKKCEKLLFRYDFDNSTNCIVWAIGGEIFPVNIFEPCTLYKDKDFECILPNDPDCFLTIRYSNYMDYLPIKNRFEEFYSGFNRFSKGV